MIKMDFYLVVGGRKRILKADQKHNKKVAWGFSSIQACLDHSALSQYKGNHPYSVYTLPKTLRQSQPTQSEALLRLSCSDLAY